MSFPKTAMHGTRRHYVILAVMSALLPLRAAGPTGTQLGTFVVVGDSLSAGFQNFSLNVTGQPNGFAAVVASQAGLNFPLPLISYPGIPPALTLQSGQIVRAAGIGARENPSVQTHNLSVPGFTVANALEYSFPGSPTTNPIDALSDSVLAEPGTTLGCGPLPIFQGAIVSEVLCALALRPDTILIAIGNNDALQALTFGSAPTPTATFALEYNLLFAALASTHAKLIVTNIPNVTQIPFLLPVPVFEVACPSPVPALPAGTTAADFVVPNITNPAATTFDVCTNYAVRPAALVASAAHAVTQFNAIIAEAARQHGAALVDFNSVVTQLSEHGYQLKNGQTLTTGFLGGLFSLDGIHPTNTGYAILANAVINAMNQQFHTSVPPISVDLVAKTDPLVP